MAYSSRNGRTYDPAPVRQPMAAQNEEPVIVDDPPGPELDDATVGTGEPDDNERAPEAVMELLRDPQVAPVLSSLIEKRAAEIAAAQKPEGAGAISAETKDLVRLLAVGIGEAIAQSNSAIAGAINRSNEAAAEQRPGYVKPYSADELEARTAAYTEARAILVDLIRRYRALLDDGQDDEAQALAPRYRLLEDAYEDASGEYQTAGTLIHWWRMPGVHMRPENGVARELSRLMWRFIGGEKQNSADVLAETLAARRGQQNMPALPEIGLLTQRPQAELRMTRVVGSEQEEIGPSNIHGTVVTVTKGALGATGTAKFRAELPGGF
jgi:hypothetical protein